MVGSGETVGFVLVRASEERSVAAFSETPLLFSPDLSAFAFA